MRVGFTGTQLGVSAAQLTALRTVLENLKQDSIDFHYGDCIGADEQAFTEAERRGFRTISHPPTDPSKRAFTKAHIVLLAKPYLERNHDISDASDVLIATPRTVIHGSCRHGTCATVRYAWRTGGFVIVIHPDGRIEDFSNVLGREPGLTYTGGGDNASGTV